MGQTARRRAARAAPPYTAAYAWHAERRDRDRRVRRVRRGVPVPGRAGVRGRRPAWRSILTSSPIPTWKHWLPARAVGRRGHRRLPDHRVVPVRAGDQLQPQRQAVPHLHQPDLAAGRGGADRAAARHRERVLEAAPGQPGRGDAGASHRDRRDLPGRDNRHPHRDGHRRGRPHRHGQGGHRRAPALRAGGLRRARRAGSRLRLRHGRGRARNSSRTCRPSSSASAPANSRADKNKSPGDSGTGALAPYRDRLDKVGQPGDSVSARFSAGRRPTGRHAGG